MQPDRPSFVLACNAQFFLFWPYLNFTNNTGHKLGCFAWEATDPPKSALSHITNHLPAWRKAEIFDFLKRKSEFKLERKRKLGKFQGWKSEENTYNQAEKRKLPPWETPLYVAEYATQISTKQNIVIYYFYDIFTGRQI